SLDYRSQNKIRSTGINVGKEWGYRSFLGGSIPPRVMYGCWRFEGLPPSLAERPEGVRCEFEFDIYRTTKGVENQGVLCDFTFADADLSVPEVNRLPETRNKLSSQGNPADVQRKMIEEDAFYQIASKEIFNKETNAITIPAALVQKLAQKAGGKPFSLQVLVNVNQGSKTQLGGVARHDMYLRDAEGTFEVNFLKGAFGMWFRMILLLGVAMMCSTYLSGIISLLAALSLYGLGLASDYIKGLAANRPGE